MPGLYPLFAQRLFSDHDEVGRVAQRDLCDRVGFDDLQAPDPNLKCLQVLEKMVGAIGFEPMTSTV